AAGRLRGAGSAAALWLRARPGRMGLLRGAAAVFGVALLGVALFVGYCLMTLPSEGGMAADPSPSAVSVASSSGEVFATRGVVKGEKLTPETIPAPLKAAIVAIEDRRFYSHFGIDLRGLARAVVRNAGGAREGGSTITQQLARLTYLSQERSLRRKVQEAALALWLDATLSKDEILARYLNAVYFGASAWGADAASRRYFGKPARDLDLGEAAMLAGLVRSPSSLAPNKNLEGARARAELVLTAVLETGAATPEQIDTARRNPVSVWRPPEVPPGTNYYLDMVEGEARRLAPDPAQDLAVTGTLDLRLQAAAERAVEKVLKEEGRAKNVEQAAVIAMAPDGAILAMVGGRDYAASQFNRAVQAKRQAGSLFKLFVYLAALKDGATPQTVMVDRPIQIADWEPENYGGRYRGPVLLRSAFATSINTVAVQLAEAVGMPAVIATARGLGVSSDLPAVPSLALGSAEVTLLEMVRAYGAVAAGLPRVEPYLLRTVSAANGAVTRHEPPAPGQGDPAVLAAMRDMLFAVVQEGTGRTARLGTTPVGGKTGTTQESRDAWFVGFTPEITIGVWVGNDDNTPTKSVTGGDLPAKIWRMVATEAQRLGAQRVAAATRARPPTPAPGGGADTPAAIGPPAAIRGRASVRDTGTLEVEGVPVRLFGVEGVGGRPARDFARYLRRRPVSCEAQGEGKSYRCALDGYDLSRVVLYNGGGRAGPDADEDLREAEQQAQAAGLGLWAR
ncbi:PBP1A family penicillin-binding protein, partial [Enterovirga sp.]|uniref:PBP1A family penicillin-binding protein n=1 Tax=Enterovirga sp. TaxID=2026350 RepID=UPI00262E9E72